MAKKKKEVVVVEAEVVTSETIAVAPLTSSAVAIMENVDGEYVVIDGEEIPIIDGFAEVNLVQPGSVRSNEALAEFVGEFLYSELGESRKELRVLPLGILRQGRQLFPPFGDGDNSPICRSYDGIVPANNVETPISEECGTVKYEKDFMGFRHTILDAICPKAKWEDDKAPDCSDFIRVAFFDLDLKAPIAITFRGTGMSAWSAFKRAYARQEKIAKLKRQKMSQYIVTMSTKNRGTYYMIEFLFRESDTNDLALLSPLAIWYRENLVRKIVESADEVEEAEASGSATTDSSGDVEGAGEGVDTEDSGSAFSV